MYYINTTKRFQNRYDLSKFMEFNENVYDVITSNMQIEIPKLPFGGIYIVKGEEARPDLISYSIYGRVEYWWILMTYNNLIRVEDIEEGMEIVYPSISDLEALYFPLSNLQSQSA